VRRFTAVGIKTNIENIGLEEVGIATDKDKILVNEYYKTNIPGYYAIHARIIGSRSFC
jgi:dihydrolipoamide dehydrogenase